MPVITNKTALTDALLNFTKGQGHCQLQTFIV